jgi:hypothetical protein
VNPVFCPGRAVQELSHLHRVRLFRAAFLAFDFCRRSRPGQVFDLEFQPFSESHHLIKARGTHLRFPHRDLRRLPAQFALARSSSLGLPQSRVFPATTCRCSTRLLTRRRRNAFLRTGCGRPVVAPVRRYRVRVCIKVAGSMIAPPQMVSASFVVDAAGKVKEDGGSVLVAASSKARRSCIQIPPNF